jgi:hypothetical protein
MIGSSLNIPLNASVSDQIKFDFRQIYSSDYARSLCMRSTNCGSFGWHFTKLTPFETATLDTVSYENEHFLLFIQPITKQYYQY